MLPDPTTQQGESLQPVLQRIAARLGTDRVLRPVLTEGHRLECMPTWQPVPQLAPRKTA